MRQTDCLKTQNPKSNYPHDILGSANYEAQNEASRQLYTYNPCTPSNPTIHDPTFLTTNEGSAKGDRGHKDSNLTNRRLDFTHANILPQSATLPGNFFGRKRMKQSSLVNDLGPSSTVAKTNST